MSAEELNADHPQHFINDPADESAPWKLPSIRRVGIITLILTETSLFSIFVVAYLWYIGRSLNGPWPDQILHYPWQFDGPLIASLCLFSSSATVTFAEFALKKSNTLMFRVWWAITILLGIGFIGYTAWEWHELIYEKHFTISTNVFGSTFYSLVGLHASHVVVGLFLLSVILVASLRGKLHHDHHEHVEIISWYWHFVDAVWVVVLLVVYVISVHAQHPAL